MRFPKRKKKRASQTQLIIQALVNRYFDIQGEMWGAHTESEIEAKSRHMVVTLAQIRELVEAEDSDRKERSK